jgi:beta-phosphoglucomutase-like phosphatase (HAD superfamily)
VDVLESTEHLLKRLDIYTKVPPRPAMTEIVVKTMVELLSILALVTKHIGLGRPSESVFVMYCLSKWDAEKFVKKLFGDNDVKASIQRLDRLNQDEARATAAQTLEVVYSLVQSMRVVIDGKRVYLASQRLAVERPFF